jgi:hypothetical protein
MIEPVRALLDGRTIGGYAGSRVRPEMPIKPSQLREDIYRILDRVLETGVPVEIERGGKLLKIIPAEPRSKLANLKPREYLLSDPEELVHLDWSGEWRP